MIVLFGRCFARTTHPRDRGKCTSVTSKSRQAMNTLPVEFFSTCRSSRGEGTILLFTCSLYTLWKNSIFRSPLGRRAGWRSNDFLVGKSEKPVLQKTARDKKSSKGKLLSRDGSFRLLIIPRDRARIDEIFNPRVMLLELRSISRCEASRVVKMTKAYELRCVRTASDRQRRCS